MFAPGNDQHQFKPLLVEIEDEPLSPLGRIVLWLVVLILLFSALWLYFGRVDVVVTARGKVIPLGEVKLIQPLTSGVVRRILVRSGQVVAAGEVLLEIDPNETEPELQSMQAELRQVALEIKRIEALLDKDVFAPAATDYDPAQLLVQHELYRSARDKLQRQIQIQRDELVRIEQQLAAGRKTCEQNDYLHQQSRQRLERLELVRDLLSRDSYEQARNDVVTYAHQLSLDQHKVEELQSSIAQVLEQIGLIENEARNQLLTELAEKRQKALYLQSTVQRTEFVNRRQQIRSPVHGYVSQLLVHTIGGVVTPAEKLAVVVPIDSPQVIKVQVLNRDVGVIAPGMEVAVKVDTFEFQKYGTLRGKLQQIEQDSREDERLGLIYEAYIEPIETTLMVDGMPMALSTGMAVTAEIKVGKRRMIEFFIYPLIKYFNEGTSVR